MTDAVARKQEVVIFIDQAQFKLEDRPYAPRELLTLAGEDPAETTLALKKGSDIQRLPDPDIPIDVKNGVHFVVFHNGPTPVS